MSRTIVGYGARGEIVRDVQRALAAAEHLKTSHVDGRFGKETEASVISFQQFANLESSGKINADTWAVLMGCPSPSLADRCLALTAAFEGHDYTLAKGNFDGAWLTWGIIGFTLKHGEVAKIILETERTFPGLLAAAFGPHSDELLAVMRVNAAEQESWAKSLSGNRGLLAEPWRTAFQLFGSFKEVQRLQRRLAIRDYFDPALATATQYGLNSELGIALCFDIQVQNGGMSKAQTMIPSRKEETELAVRVSIAKSVAASARPAYRRDVLSRKLTIAEGEGTVHGVEYDLSDWGLEDVPAELVLRTAAGH